MSLGYSLVIETLNRNLRSFKQGNYHIMIDIVQLYLGILIDRILREHETLTDSLIKRIKMI